MKNIVFAPVMPGLFFIANASRGAKIESLSHRPYYAVKVPVIASVISNKNKIKIVKIYQNTPLLLSGYYGIMCSEKTKGRTL